MVVPPVPVFFFASTFQPCPGKLWSGAALHSVDTTDFVDHITYTGIHTCHHPLFATKGRINGGFPPWPPAVFRGQSPSAEDFFPSEPRNLISHFSENIHGTSLMSTSQDRRTISDIAVEKTRVRTLCLSKWF